MHLSETYLIKEHKVEPRKMAHAAHRSGTVGPDDTIMPRGAVVPGTCKNHRVLSELHITNSRASVAYHDVIEVLDSADDRGP